MEPKKEEKKKPEEIKEEKGQNLKDSTSSIFTESYYSISDKSI